MSRAIRHKLGWSYKKRRWRPPSETKRREVLSGSAQRGRPERLLFVDESSTNIAMVPRYARAPKGERAHGKAPRNWGKNVTLISSVGFGDGSVNEHRRIFRHGNLRTLHEEHLAPLCAGQIVLMDNLSVHTSKWLRTHRGEGTSAAALPQDSPDRDPIEEAFSKVKNL